MSKETLLLTPAQCWLHYLCNLHLCRIPTIRHLLPRIPNPPRQLLDKAHLHHRRDRSCHCFRRHAIQNGRQLSGYYRMDHRSDVHLLYLEYVPTYLLPYQQTPSPRSVRVHCTNPFFAQQVSSSTSSPQPAPSTKTTASHPSAPPTTRWP